MIYTLPIGTRVKVRISDPKGGIGDFQTCGEGVIVGIGGTVHEYCDPIASGERVYEVEILDTHTIDLIAEDVGFLECMSETVCRLSEAQMEIA